jgi:hypothetical protein
MVRKMIGTYLQRIFVSGCILLVLTLAACGNTAGTAGNTATPTTTTRNEVSTNPTIAQSTPTAPSVATLIPVISTPGHGPVIILTPTPVPGGSVNSQLIGLPDRTLAILNVGKQQASDASSTLISLNLTMQNTGKTSIPNQPSYYQLVGSEGDMFGSQSSASPSFFGTITPHASRGGTIVFQIPSAAVSGLRLLFRSEIATETVFVQLKIS